MEDTIELREIINIILKGKRVIISITMILILIFGILSWFVLPKKYESVAVVQITNGIQDTGLISNYINTEFTPVIYTERINDELLMNKKFNELGFSEFQRKELIATTPSNTTIVKLSYKASTANEAQEQLQVLMEETKANMSEAVYTTMLELKETYSSEGELLSEEIGTLMEKYNKLIITNNLPEVLILQTIASTQFVIDLSGKQIEALAKIDGNLQSQLLQIKAQIDAKSTEYNAVLTKYQSVKTGMDSFSPDPFIRLIVEPTLAKAPTSPNGILNLAIGLILGLLIGLGTVFFQEYWRKPNSLK